MTKSKDLSLLILEFLDAETKLKRDEMAAAQGRTNQVTTAAKWVEADIIKLKIEHIIMDHVKAEPATVTAPKTRYFKAGATKP